MEKGRIAICASSVGHPLLLIHPNKYLLLAHSKLKWGPRTASYCSQVCVFARTSVVHHHRLKYFCLPSKRDQKVTSSPILTADEKSWVESLVYQRSGESSVLFSVVLNPSSLQDVCRSAVSCVCSVNFFFPIGVLKYNQIYIKRRH